MLEDSIAERAGKTESFEGRTAHGPADDRGLFVPPIQWTTEKPTRPGFYWLKGSAAVAKQIMIVEVFYHHHIRSQIFVRFFDCECGMDVSGVDGEWYGPLRPPGE